MQMPAQCAFWQQVEVKATGYNPAVQIAQSAARNRQAVMSSSHTRGPWVPMW